MADDGASANDLGRIYDQLGLNSIAFRYYDKAAETGVSVGKVNMANLLRRADNAGAGLKILSEHSGGFDAAAPGYPYNMRGQLESKVAEEQGEADKLNEVGKLLFSRLGSFAEELILHNVGKYCEKYIRNEIWYRSEVGENGDFTLTRMLEENGQKMSFKKLSPDWAAWSLWINDKCAGLFRTDETGRLVGISVDLSSKEDCGKSMIFEVPPI